MGYASSPFGHRGFVAAATRQAEQKKARASAGTQTPKRAGKITGVEGVRVTTRRRLSTADATRASDAPDSKRGKWTALLQLTRGTAADRIALVRSGIAADDVPSLIAALELPTSAVLNALQIARTSLARRIAKRSVLALDESERVVGLVGLIGQVAQMLQDSGVPEQSSTSQAAKWLGAWLAVPNNALGGAQPVAYLDTAEGRGLVSHVLGAMEAGTYW